jgi:hypothetical protein
LPNKNIFCNDLSGQERQRSTVSNAFLGFTFVPNYYHKVLYNNKCRTFSWHFEEQFLLSHGQLYYRLKHGSSVVGW